ncbi:PaaI family thioesterase [Rhodococcus sp. HNM0563]|uniref:PaaI family thioesterase n=1 Tax=unclassified Rhodococcus (in: high G+C Gram-positive bacteria) TaxID=192944 RepID=UPI00146D0767|nr:MULTISPECIES: PaaI family thioesterase [unclassified Rhodococcus (in: high G+C Gram-positive bacteria)]MCK0090762.1 PaaI family thioesterase [Rhodococcus sp. F64268]NLU61955.1 PaaI family thioesterase [Rhodococcus sp. HNM0563]
MTLEIATFPIDRPATYSGVGVSVSPDSVSVTQTVGPKFFDHRGQVTISAFGALSDIVGAAPAGVARQHATGVVAQAVLAQLTASTANPFPHAGQVSGVGRSMHFDDTSGLSSAEILDENGNLVLHLTGRTIVVGRTPTDRAGSAADPFPTAPDEYEPWIDGHVLDSTSGLDVVSGIAAGTLPRGPLAGMHDLRVHTVERGAVRATVTPSEWMTNFIGSIQGGVLLSIAESVTGLAAQSLTEAGGQYRMLQITLDYLRSPAVPGPPVQVRSDVVRAGRRLASLETLLTGEDGTVYVRAYASVQLFARSSEQR